MAAAAATTSASQAIAGPASTSKVVLRYRASSSGNTRRTSSSTVGHPTGAIRRARARNAVRAMHLRRHWPAGLEGSLDGVQWAQVTCSLAEIGDEKQVKGVTGGPV